MIALLSVHPSQAGRLAGPERLTTSPAVPIESYLDGFGNRCSRMVAPAGLFRLTTGAVVNDDGRLDPLAPDAREWPVEWLPADTLQFLLGSRYCETDLLSEEAWHRFQHVRPGWSRVQAICDYVHTHLRFDYMQARATRTAAEANAERVGVCRDYTHLAITLCRCLNIPARYCTGYITDIGLPPPYAPQDYAAWMEVWLDGQWWTFDPRNNERRIGRILVARGRDAADVPLTHTFGSHVLTGFEVIADEIVEEYRAKIA
ncbi:MAG: transglutaminase family protein [Rhodobacteraceae bacterium]|nr:transglutaminase family protein [Paracoccaceae bacterium]